METFLASRLTAGNKVFPAEIIIDQHGVTLKIPGLFSGSETTVPYTRISSVDITCPFIGYSSIVISTTGEGDIRAHGFRKNQVIRMKNLILARINEEPTTR
ncbi:MAG: PH domain-containing protein [Bacteroidales bacterium]